MGWKSVVMCACLVPVLAGCGALRHAGSRSAGDTERVVAPPDAGARAPIQWAKPAQPTSKFGPPAADGSVAERRPAATDGAEKLVPPLPKPELPVIKPFDPPVPTEASLKFAPTVPPPDPDLLPAPSVPYPSLAVPAGRLPEPAPVTPTPATAIPTVLDTIPPIPFLPPK